MGATASLNRGVGGLARRGAGRERQLCEEAERRNGGCAEGFRGECFIVDNNLLNVAVTGLLPEGDERCHFPLQRWAQLISWYTAVGVG
jgi:hypothetical protein